MGVISRMLLRQPFLHHTFADSHKRLRGHTALGDGVLGVAVAGGGEIRATELLSGPAHTAGDLPRGPWGVWQESYLSRLASGAVVWVEKWGWRWGWRGVCVWWGVRVGVGGVVFPASKPAEPCTSMNCYSVIRPCTCAHTHTHTRTPYSHTQTNNLTFCNVMNILLSSKCMHTDNLLLS